MTRPAFAPVLALAVLAALALTGCETYSARLMQPAALQVAPRVWRLTVDGRDGGRARERVLLRAADLTLAERGDWFRVRDRDGGPVGDGWGLGGTSDASDLLSSPGAGYAATLEIEVGSGPSPGGRDVYDARQVAMRLRGAAPRHHGQPI